MIIWKEGWDRGHGIAEGASGRWCEVVTLGLDEFDQADAVTYAEAAEYVRENTRANHAAGKYRDGVTLGYAIGFALDFEHLRED